ncbi:protein containing response regulator receiver d omain [Lunatimonas lonarensis]|uniref:Protein containing response regulator receiver d omain n=1 Tax=Lunatimonas lonarensis TaxID=1232681 RepID=R7ZQC8_9BACT|nr:response regulator [Lunatimonas lonarensis]EON76258.1 protein containing response regulator receiver d omain [Lunatimonas lonarensis]
MKSTFSTLIVDDDKLALHYIMRRAKETLIPGDFHVAENGKEAIDKLEDLSDDTDQVLVLLDLNMPVMTGWDFLDLLTGKPYKEKTLVVIVTSSTSQIDKDRSKKYKEVIGYIEKPLATETLREVLYLFDNNLIVTKPD